MAGNGTITAQAATVRLKYSGGAYHFFVNGARAYVKNNWVTYNRHRYFISPYGYICTGWKKIDGSWYYFSKTGIMQTGKKKISGKTYRLSSSGKLISPSSPKGIKAQKANTFSTKKTSSKKSSKPSARTSSSKAAVKRASSSKSVTQKGTGSVKLRYSGGAYRFFVNGAKTYVKNNWVIYNGHHYFINPNGYICTGWKKVSGSWYYFSPGGIMQTGTKKISGQTYKFASSGKLVSPSSPSGIRSAKSNTQTATVTKPAVSSSSAKTAVKRAGSAAAGTSSLSGSQKVFVDQVYSCIKKYAPSYGIKTYSPIIAQAILESDWGRSQLSARYHNYFGLTCGTTWTGRRVSMKTKEEVKGKMVSTSADWRVFNSMDAGVKGYFEFINARRYQNLKGVKDPQTYLTNIKKDGYATSSVYVTSNMNIIKKYGLTRYDP